MLAMGCESSQALGMQGHSDPTVSCSMRRPSAAGSSRRAAATRSTPLTASDDAVAKEQLVSALVNDALALIEATESSELTASQQDAVGLVALVAGQDAEPAGRRGRRGSRAPWRRTG